jgi:hypothetical protein
MSFTPTTALWLKATTSFRKKVIAHSSAKTMKSIERSFFSTAQSTPIDNAQIGAHRLLFNWEIPKQ